jgi:D-alanyl-lipoteichoic acid acyltransferase DltB (MBOAT superfamily)
VKSRLLLSAGITLNLCLLGYFKYFAFFATQADNLLGLSLPVASVVLPLGISFFTFQKIAYLVDCYQNQTPAHNYFSFSLFVLFFPQLIAGPITHARQIVPQIMRLPSGIIANNLAIGLTIFTIGLCKKMLIADSLGPWVNTTFASAASQPPTLITAWLGAIGFGLQIYFDFSGYSDMAIGLARIFGVRLPINFDSPYKSRSITDFWRRWHITLSHFLRDYLYIPLGGAKRRRHLNLVITMTLGGLWHGAGWTFMLWGLLHGLCLVGHKLWVRVRRQPLPSAYAWALTLLTVVVLWVPFRAPTMDATLAIWRGMSGLNGVAFPAFLSARVGGALSRFVEFRQLNLEPHIVLFWMPLGALVALYGPNTQSIMKHSGPALMEDALDAQPIRDTWATWRPTVRLGVLLGVALTACALKFNDVTQFVYFQF